MSGGHFDYDQYKIDQIANDVEQVILQNGKEIPYKDLDDWQKRDYDRNNPPKYYDFPPEVIEKFKEGLKVLRKAYIYAQRIDWLLSGDDGEENFLERLKEDLKKEGLQ